MLDDLSYIHQHDPEDALGVSGKQWQYLSSSFAANLSIDTPIKNVVLGGMGGSGWPGLILKSWPGVTVPFEIVSNYTLPPYVSPETLFISSSYSGNTEETLEALGRAEEAGAQIVVVTSGGKLLEIAQQKQYPLYQIPSGIQPRMATTYFLNAFTQILSALSLAATSTAELTEVGEWLHSELDGWAATVPAASNLAKRVAQDIAGKSAVVYAGPLLYPAAHKLKICINENAKNTAWAAQYPEFSHNEFIGWSSHPVDKPFAVIEFRSNLEHPRVQKRFSVTEQLLSGRRPTPIVIEPEGDTLLKQLVWSVALGDFIATYLALLNQVDPTPVDLVERLKKELG